MTTDFSKQVEILGQLHVQYQDAFLELKDFVEFNDIGLPLAYLASEGLCDISDDGRRYVAETWELFLTSVGVQDVGFEDLHDVFRRAQGS